MCNVYQGKNFLSLLIRNYVVLLSVSSSQGYYYLYSTTLYGTPNETNSIGRPLEAELFFQLAEMHSGPPSSVRPMKSSSSFSYLAWTTITTGGASVAEC